MPKASHRRPIAVASEVPRVDGRAGTAGRAAPRPVLLVSSSRTSRAGRRDARRRRSIAGGRDLPIAILGGGPDGLLVLDERAASSAQRGDHAAPAGVGSDAHLPVAGRVRLAAPDPGRSADVRRSTDTTLTTVTRRSGGVRRDAGAYRPGAGRVPVRNRRRRGQSRLPAGRAGSSPRGCRADLRGDQAAVRGDRLRLEVRVPVRHEQAAGGCRHRPRARA